MEIDFTQYWNLPFTHFLWVKDVFEIYITYFKPKLHLQTFITFLLCMKRILIHFDYSVTVPYVLLLLQIETGDKTCMILKQKFHVNQLIVFKEIQFSNLCYRL